MDAILNITSIPAYITYSTFDDIFNSSLGDYLLPNITHLTFGRSFNRSIDNTTMSVTHLTFGYDFNQPTNSMSDTTTHLTFSDNYDQYTNILSQSITHSVGISTDHTLAIHQRSLT